MSDEEDNNETWQEMLNDDEMNDWNDDVSDDDDEQAVNPNMPVPKQIEFLVGVRRINKKYTKYK